MGIFDDEPWKRNTFDPGWFGLPQYNAGQTAIIQGNGATLLATIYNRGYVSTTSFERNLGWNYSASVVPVRRHENTWKPVGARDTWEQIPQELLAPDPLRWYARTKAR